MYRTVNPVSFLRLETSIDNIHVNPTYRFEPSRNNIPSKWSPREPQEDSSNSLNLHLHAGSNQQRLFRAC
uniref:Uncharacterized protein n=1 Tax=Arion vulgaris TaxID=1028688 RepID=A0A0B6YVA0_9EUPU